MDNLKQTEIVKEALLLETKVANANCKLNSLLAQKYMPDTSEVKHKIDDLLNEIGVPFHMRGYLYLKESIMMIIEKPEVVNETETKLYPLIAEKYDTTTSRVKRAIRHIIEVVWDRGDIDILNSYFENDVYNDTGKPTNSKFISAIFNRIKNST